MSERFRPVVEEIARKTSRRGFLTRGWDVVFGALAGAAAGSVIRPGSTSAGSFTACAFPGPPCPCHTCRSTGVCSKPCAILTTYYASGCWMATNNTVTCCDCDCLGNEGAHSCGCGTDWHNDPTNCPDGVADT